MIDEVLGLTTLNVYDYGNSFFVSLIMYIIIAPAELPSKKSICCHWDIWNFHLHEWWDSLSEYDAIFPKEIKRIRIQNKRPEQTLCFSDNAGGSWAKNSGFPSSKPAETIPQRESLSPIGTEKE